jgi:hypothetical protein
MSDVKKMILRNRVRYSVGSHWQLIASIALALFLATALVARAQETVNLPLEPMNGSGVSGTATLTASDGATHVVLEVTGLAANATARATMHAGTCTTPSASFATLPDLEADASGDATATGSVLFRGTEDVALATMADGEHIIAIQSQAGIAACGVIPTLTSETTAPAALPTTGGAVRPLMVVATAMLGLGVLSAGLLLRRRQQPTGQR